MTVTKEKFEEPEGYKEIVEAWFPDGLPDEDDEKKIIASWAGISLRLCLMPMEAVNAGRKFNPVAINRIRRTMEFLGIGWFELEQGAVLAIQENVKALREIVPDVPEWTPE